MPARRAVFQLHLWLGIVLSLYVAVLGVTGSILVFRAELELRRLPAEWRASQGAGQASADTVVANLAAAFPQARVVSLNAPDQQSPLFTATLAGRQRVTVASDRITGRVLGPVPPAPAWLTFVRRLHETLLIRGTGRTVNGVGAVLLLLMATTGLVTWWPGASRWWRALYVDPRFGWRRITFDLHRAVGIWALVLITGWAITGIYFGWTRQVFALVNDWSPVVSARPPAVVVEPGESAASPGLDALIGQASAIDPGTRWSGIFFPFSRRAPIQIIMQRPGGDGREYQDTIYFNPSTGEHLATWRYGVNESVGDWLIWLQIPLHFGTSWGLAVKGLWALAGLALPLLASTGLVMYWNRVLRHQLKRRG
ncbi:MAG: PepSY-associated TM helix domain-containing protein [Vicinamibacterales bacterium]